MSHGRAHSPKFGCALMLHVGGLGHHREVVVGGGRATRSPELCSWQLAPCPTRHRGYSGRCYDMVKLPPSDVSAAASPSGCLTGAGNILGQARLDPGRELTSCPIAAPPRRIAREGECSGCSSFAVCACCPDRPYRAREDLGCDLSHPSGRSSYTMRCPYCHHFPPTAAVSHAERNSTRGN